METREQAAWRAFRSTATRPKYDNHPGARRLGKTNDRFKQRVIRDPHTECWAWTGPTYNSGPICYVWSTTRGRTMTRSAFLWLMEQWFPSVEFADGSRSTQPVCGNRQCISPFHRKSRGYEHLTKLTRTQVLAVFAKRDQRDARGVAVEFGVSEGAVHGIWSGRFHRSITGQPEVKRSNRKLTAEQATEVYAARGGSGTQRELAERYGVSRATIRRIWDGTIWSEVTGHRLSGKQMA